MVATTATPGELSSPGDLCEGRPLAVGSGGKGIFKEARQRTAMVALCQTQ